MNKAIFLDRDGVINVERGYTHRLEDFVILPDVMEVLQQWQKQNFLLIVITNQSGIAKGF
jgi:D-glycero-D-manno-heptose 1,7-bisphosphate phosphatase